jgi:hypothetical protein
MASAVCGVNTTDRPPSRSAKLPARLVPLPARRSHVSSSPRLSSTTAASNASTIAVSTGTCTVPSAGVVSTRSIVPNAALAALLPPALLPPPPPQAVANAAIAANPKQVSMRIPVVSPLLRSPDRLERGAF